MADACAAAPGPSLICRCRCSSRHLRQSVRSWHLLEAHATVLARRIVFEGLTGRARHVHGAGVQTCRDGPAARAPRSDSRLRMTKLRSPDAPPVATPARLHLDRASIPSRSSHPSPGDLFSHSGGELAYVRARLEVSKQFNLRLKAGLWLVCRRGWVDACGGGGREIGRRWPKAGRGAWEAPAAACARVCRLPCGR